MPILREQNSFQTKNCSYKDKGKMKYSCIIKAEGDKELYDALKPDKSKSKRAQWDISKKKDYVEIKIEAMDVVALKAFMHSITKLIEVYEKISENGQEN